MNLKKHISPKFNVSFRSIKDVLRLIKIKNISFIFLLLNIIFNPQLAFAEGTKQLNPTASDVSVIQIKGDVSDSKFAEYTANADERLFIHICHPGETVYMGFNTKLPAKFRVKDPSGNIVFGELDVPLDADPSTSVGKINTYTEAVLGPKPSDPNGYTPFSFVATQAGDYYIEFDISSRGAVNGGVNKAINMFDISVAETNGIIRNGRLWSKAWMINTGAGPNKFEAEMYIYTDDKITTKVDFNGIQPYEFVISSNNTGVGNTGNTALDRQSTNGNNKYHKFKIFLNEPDTACFETGYLGDIVGSPSITGCPGNYCINVEVSAPGNMMFVIEANGIPGFQAGTKDRIIQAPVYMGTPNCIPWDGNNGLGEFVGNNATVALSIQYVNGLTHLPIFDVENHVNGYHVTYVRPKPTSAGNDVTLFWDDSKITVGSALDGKTNSITGCQLTTGCHRWTNRGKTETINTWWFVKESTASIVYDYVDHKVDANTSTSGRGKFNDTSVCSNTLKIPLKGGIIGDSVSKWTILKGSGSFTSPDSLETIYTLSASDRNLDTLALVISNIHCPIVHDTIKIALEKLPKLTMPSPFSICSNNTTLTTSATIANVGGIAWRAGDGKFVDSLKTSIQYKPSQKEIDSSYVKLYAKTLPKVGQLCPMVNDSVKISIYVPATLNAPSDTVLCQSSSASLLKLVAKSTSSDSVVWSSNNAFLPNPKKGDSTTFNLSSATSFKVFVLAYKKGCLPIKDSLVVKFEAQPKVTAFTTDTCSSDLRVKLSGTSTLAGAKAKATWSSSGNGIFASHPDSLNNFYIPSKLDSTLGMVKLKLKSQAQTKCKADSMVRDYVIVPLPIAKAGNDMVVCVQSSVSKSSIQNTNWKYEWRTSKAGAIEITSSTYTFVATKDTNRVFLSVKNSRNCVAEDSAVVATIKPPTIVLPSDICLYKNSSISATIKNAPALGTYVWKRKDTSLAVSSTTLLIDTAATYTYNYEFNGACRSADTIVAFQIPKMVVRDTSACPGEATQFTANPIAGAKYYWTSSAINNGTNRFPITSNVDVPGIKALVIDKNGCRDSTTVNFQVFPQPHFTLLGDSICPNESKQMKAVLANPALEGGFPITHRWTKNLQTISSSSWKSLDYATSGTYILELGIKGCKAYDTVVIVTKPAAKIDMPLKYKHCFETDTPLKLQSNAFSKYNWFSEDGSLGNSQSIEVAPMKDSRYFLKVENKFSCKDSTEMLVRKVCAPRLFVPNVVTPESNDVNATLQIFGANYTNFEIVVYSRWGEVVFRSKDPKNTWDGNYKNDQMPIGNFQWQVTYEGDTEEYKGPYKKTGDVAVIR